MTGPWSASVSASFKPRWGNGDGDGDSAETSMGMQRHQGGATALAAKTNIAPVRATHPPWIERRGCRTAARRRPRTLKATFVDGAGRMMGRHDVSSAEGAVVGQRPSWSCYRSAPGGMSTMQSLPRG